TGRGRGQPARPHRHPGRLRVPPALSGRPRRLPGRTARTHRAAGRARRRLPLPGNTRGGVMTDVVLRATDLVKHFPAGSGLARLGRRAVVRAVDGVSVALRRGETLGVVGESGCGKSTLARLLVALERPTAGTVEVHGRDI